MTSDQQSAAAKRRANQTLKNLVYALISSLGIVLVLIMVVPRNDNQVVRDIDFAGIAAEAQPDAPMQLAAPVLPDTWVSNEARWTASPQDGVPTWYMGFIIDQRRYIGVTQAYQANPTWLNLLLENAIPTGSTTIAGHDFVVYDQRENSDASTLKRYALVTEIGDTTITLYGGASVEEFETLAAATVESIESGSG